MDMYHGDMAYNDKGFATITQSEKMPAYYNSEGRFMYISGNIENKDYTSMVLDGGSKYYLHIGYSKDTFMDSNEDRVIINSIKLYDVGTVSYNFGDVLPYESNNKKDNTTANSYIPINLTNYPEQKIAVVVNAEISSDGFDDDDYAFGDVGYATITTSADRVAYDDYNSTTKRRFINIAGKQKAKDYTIILDGGSQYYLHLGYYKDEQDDGFEEDITDTFTINSVNVYETKIEAYNFKEETTTQTTIVDGKKQEITNKKYVSTNEGKANTKSASYIPINLVGVEGKVNIIVNAEISSEYNDYGFATITTSNQVPSSYSSGTRVISNIREEQEAKDYVATIEGGEQYYLHFIYNKDDEEDGGKDQFIINSVKVVLNRNHLYDVEVVTDENGQAFASLPMEPTAKYNITEIEAPGEYELANPQIYEMKQEGGNELTINDVKRPKLIVHHYLQGTGVDDIEATEVAEDEIYMGRMGEKYETQPRMDLEKYELVKLDSGEYDIPINAKGTYEWKNVEEANSNQGEKSSGTNEEQEGKGQLVIEVTYYYTPKKIPLIVHHYIEGTTTPVPTANGEQAKDEIIEGAEKEEYTTQALKPFNDKVAEESKKLDERYEVVGEESKTIEYEYPEVEVTYEYRLKKYEITTKVQTHMEEDEVDKEKQIEVRGGSILGEGDTPYETVEYGKSNEKEIEITPEEGYHVKSIKINETELTDSEYTTKEDRVIKLNTINDIKENKEIVVEFEKIPAEVIVNYYIYDEKIVDNPYTTKRVPLSNGKISEEYKIEGLLGDIYVTKELENVSRQYKLYKEPANKTGIMETERTEVNYYYISYGALIENTVIAKDGSDKIVSKDEEIHYKIKYTTQIDGYTGNATVTITDTLPYKLDLDKMKEKYDEKHSESHVSEQKELETQNETWLQEVLDGGEYHEDNGTITWTYTEEVDTTTEGKAKVIELEKEIEVIFKEVNTTEKAIENKVKASIYLDGTDQTEETEEVSHTTQAEYIKDIKITKKWEHGANIYERPTQIKVKIINPKTPDEAVDEQVLSEENNWTYTFKGLPKYDESTGEEIQYTVEEEAIEGQSLDYYKRAI